MAELPEIDGELLVDPARGWADRDLPLAFVELAGLQARPESLPPYPVVGLGSPLHPYAASLDCILEPPFTGGSLVREVQRNPKAAAILVQLLRRSEAASAEQALFAESLAYGLLQGSAEHAAWIRARGTSGRKALPEGRLDMRREGEVLRVTLDRKEARNAIDRHMRDGLFAAFELAALDDEIEAVVLASTGPAFSIGGDLSEFGTTRDPAEAHLIRCRTLPAMPLLRCADRLNVHVQGACVGAGLEIAAFARRVTAANSAWFQLPELSMGLIPGAGGCVSVPRRIGRQRAALMMLTGKRIGAATALDWGLIDAIEDDPSVDDRRPDPSGA